jgi:hypothetical protein
MNDRELMQQALEALEIVIADAKTTPSAYEAQRQAIAALRERLAQPAPPPECKTEEEKTAFAFGWLKAVEAQRLAQLDPMPLFDDWDGGIPYKGGKS